MGGTPKHCDRRCRSPSAPLLPRGTARIWGRPCICRDAPLVEMVHGEAWQGSGPHGHLVGLDAWIPLDFAAVGTNESYRHFSLTITGGVGEVARGFQAGAERGAPSTVRPLALPGRRPREWLVQLGKICLKDWMISPRSSLPSEDYFKREHRKGQRLRVALSAQRHRNDMLRGREALPVEIPVHDSRRRSSCRRGPSTRPFHAALQARFVMPDTQEGKKKRRYPASQTGHRGSLTAPRGQPRRNERLDAPQQVAGEITSRACMGLACVRMRPSSSSMEAPMGTPAPAGPCLVCRGTNMGSALHPPPRVADVSSTEGDHPLILHAPFPSFGWAGGTRKSATPTTGDRPLRPHSMSATAAQKGSPCNYTPGRRSLVFASGLWARNNAGHPGMCVEGKEERAQEVPHEAKRCTTH